MTGAVRFIATTWLVLGVCAGAFGQAIQTGVLRGIVRDAQGLPVPGVTVTVTSPALQGQRSAVSDEGGNYAIHLLPAGRYTVRFELQGFKPVERDVDVPLGSEAEQNAELQPAAVAEGVTVTAEAPPLVNPTLTLNIRQEEVEALATSRTLHGITTLAPALNENTPNTRQVSINGSFGYDNAWMLNGVDVNDNLFGSPQNLFIEDAIEETQVITSGIPAEYGRFSGGVINAITRSGGNTFSGSFRLNLTNPSWTDETPFEDDNDITRESEVNDTYEATLGGPILRDRLWFFGAYRLANTSTTETFDFTGVPYTATDENWRLEGKLTGTVVPGHVVQGGFLNNPRTLENDPSFGFSIDPRTLDNIDVRNWYGFGNYRAVFGSSLLGEAQFSERRYSPRGLGGDSTNIIDSPFISVSDDGWHYNGPYFDATDPEERNNRQVAGNLTYFAHGAGRHEIKGGWEWYRSQLTGGNSQSPTSYVFDADFLKDADGDPVLDANGRLIPLFTPNAAFLENWLAVRGAELNVDNNSFFIQDHWTIGPRLSANLGLRYERVRSKATGGIVGVDTDTVVPRLALTYDVRGDGNVVLSTTYGHYAGRYIEPQVGENTNVGNPDRTIGAYIGPPGQGLDFAPGFDPANYQTFLGIFPTANVFFEDGLSSPLTKEFTVSGGVAAGPRAYAELTYVWRRASNFIEDFVTADNGFTEVVRDGFNHGTFTNIVYRNTDDLFRRYQALVLQSRYRLSDRWTANGQWTLQLENEGNFTGEAPNQPGLPSIFGDYPEAFTEERHYPTGRLNTFQRHRVRLWTIYDFTLGRFGNLSASGLWRIESGPAYSLAAVGVPLTEIQEQLLAGYPDSPGTQTLYFGERGSETFPGYGVMDFSVNYAIPVFRSLRPWLKADVFNLLNNDKVIAFDTTVLPNEDGPVDELGLPTTFIEGVNFGEPRGPGDFPPSLQSTGGRTFRLSFGVRF